MSATPVRVALVEDNAVFREALELLLGLRPDIDVVGAVEDGTQVVEMCRRLDGVQTTRALRDACPDVAVVGLTASANPREVDALYGAGAVACLTKDEHLDKIVAAILSAAGRSE